MGDVFISYKNEDHEVAGKLAHALEQKGWSVFWDKDIPPGQTFDSYISERLSAARCIVVLWSTQSVSSNWVKEEAQVGVQRKILVPALIEDIQLPLGFRRIEAAKLWDWDGTGPHVEFASMLAAIERILAASGAATGPGTRAAAGRMQQPHSTTHSVTSTQGTPHGGNKHNTAIAVALIALVAVLGFATISNWDRIFGTPTDAGTSGNGNGNGPEDAIDDRSRLSNLQVISQTDQQLILQVDYVSAEVTDSGKRIGLGAYALRDGRQLKYFSYRPASISSPHGTARVTLTLMTERAPESLITDEVRLDLYRGGGAAFHEQVFPLRKRWRKDAGEL